LQIIKKDGTLENYDEQKIINACNKAARRAMIELSDQDYQIICNAVYDKLVENDLEETEIYEMHNIVEAVLEEHYPLIAKMYKEYRNYKKDFVHMMDKVYERSQAIRYIGDKSNANTDSALVATKRSLIYNELNGELYKKFFLTLNEKQAMKDGYIYIHDRSARLDTFNCDLMRVGYIMQGGFEMGNVWYNEPNSLDTAFDVMGDIILSTAAQQYGGFTVPEVDKILAPYAEKSYQKYYNEYYKIIKELEEIDFVHISDDLQYKLDIDNIYNPKTFEEMLLNDAAKRYATRKVQRDFEQGWQGIEYKLNTVGSSRGDYPFVTMTIGLATDKFGKMAAITLLNVHKEGQGKKGFKRPVLFPKIVFLYDKNLHGDGSEEYPSADVFNAGIACSSKTMYPDWLSLTGNGYVPEMYKKYGRVVSPMGKCKSAHVKRYLTVA
jgi:anaerobic ribonucleoside-triphosphate reductase